MRRVGKSVSRKVTETYVRAALAVCVCLVMLVSPGFGGGQIGDQPSSGTKGALVGAGLGALAGQAIGGDYGQERISQPDDWDIQLKPYFWMPSLDADATVSGLSGSVDLGFDDVIDNLDFGAMGRVEAWKNKWGLTFDGLFMNLGASGSFEGSHGVTSFDLDADVRLGMADFGLAYRLFEGQFGNSSEQRLTFEPYGGLRYAYLRQRIDLNVNIAGIGSVGAKLGGSEDWVEPFVGGRVRWDLNDELALNFRGDAGGFGIGSASDLLWQIAFGVDYQLSKNTSLNAGYRIVDLDYSRGSGSNELGIDLRAEGPFVGITILF